MSTMSKTAGGNAMAFSVKELCMTAMFAVILAVCSWISVPIMEVPVTLQTFGVFLALEMLGGKCGTAAVTVFVLLGAIGVPVFAGFSGGLGILLGSTGGYILGFILMAVIYWLGEKLPGFDKIIWLRGAVLVVGLAVCYLFGTVWFIKVYTEDITVMTALKWCVIPFLIPDAVKLICAMALAGRLKKYVRS